jgi:antitoxin (DNA-binding transcriptional repressor) of toxin-antitoxin stability system
MRIVKIAEAKAQLSRYLAYVRRGGCVRILDRDTPVADLVPAPAGGQDTEEDRWLAVQERRGLIRRGSPGAIPKDLFEPGPPADLLQALLGERKRSR